MLYKVQVDSVPTLNYDLLYKREIANLILLQVYPESTASTVFEVGCNVFFNIIISTTPGFPLRHGYVIYGVL